MTTNHPAVFFTGAGGFLGRYILTHYLRQTDFTLYLLEHPQFAPRLRAFVDSTAPDQASRVHIVEGDITVPGLRLDKTTADAILATVTRAIHLAAIYDISVPLAPALRVNVQGTQHVLEFLAKAQRLERFAYMSTTAISGTHQGPFRDTDFDLGQGFKNHYEKTKFLAEKLVRDYWDRIPTTILRPTVVVGDSKTGLFEKMDGPYCALTAIARNLHLTMPDAKGSKCHAEPVDFVTDAFYCLLEDEWQPGSVYHLADPNPRTFNEFVDLACDAWPKMRPLMTVPPALLKPLFLFPPTARLMGVSYDAYKYTLNRVEYEPGKSTEILARHGIVCPPIPAYIDPMVFYFKQHHRDRAIRRGRLYALFS